MSTVWAASVRHLLRHPAQLVLALAGLALGVATITAVDIATASSSRAFELSLAAVDGPATSEIEGGPNGIDERLYVELATRHPRLLLAPIVEGYVTVRGEALQLVGLDPLAEASFRGSPAPAAGPALLAGAGDAGTADSDGGAGSTASGSAASGSAASGPAASGPAAGGSAPGITIASGADELARWLTEPGAVAMDSSTAARLGIAVNERFEVGIDGREHSAILISREQGQAGTGALLLTDISQAQEWLGLDGRLSRIELALPPGAAGAAERARIRAELPPGVALEPAQQRSRASLDMVRAFTTDLRAMSLLALLVGLFLIYSAMSFAVLQRRKIFAVLRALGATRVAILRLVLAEAAVLGAAGALIGLFAGIGLGRGLVALVSGTINDLYFVVAVNSVTLPPSAVAEAVGAGVLTALVAALLPAWEATGVAPQLGLRRSVLERRARGAARRLLMVSAVLGAAAGAIVALSSRSLLAGFVALFLLLLSVAAAAPALLEGSARLAARLTGRASPIGRIALGGVAASLSRTGVAVAALGLAIAAMIGVSVMVASFRESLDDWLGRTMSADIYVSAPGPGFGRPERRLEPPVIAALESVPGVARASASRSVRVGSSRGPVMLEAVTLAPKSTSGIVLTARRADVWQAFAHGAILVSQSLAWRFELHPGGRLALWTARGPRPFEIAGVYRDYGTGGGVLIDRSVYRGAWGDSAVTSLGLYLSPGARAAQVIPALYAAARGRQALLIASNADVRTMSMSLFDRTFLITRVLDWLAAGVAAIGLASSLLAWELERAHEVSVLRSLGLAPRGAALLIEAQTLFMGLVALAAAIPAGLLAAYLLVTVINRRAFGWQIDFHLQGGMLGSALRLALIAALAAGLYPAWRSARRPVAADVREE